MIPEEDFTDVTTPVIDAKDEEDDEENYDYEEDKIYKNITTTPNPQIHKDSNPHHMGKQRGTPCHRLWSASVLACSIVCFS